MNTQTETPEINTQAHEHAHVHGHERVTKPTGKPLPTMTLPPSRKSISAEAARIQAQRMMDGMIQGLTGISKADKDFAKTLGNQWLEARYMQAKAFESNSITDLVRHGNTCNQLEKMLMEFAGGRHCLVHMECRVAMLATFKMIPREDLLDEDGPLLHAMSVEGSLETGIPLQESMPIPMRDPKSPIEDLAKAGGDEILPTTQTQTAPQPQETTQQ